MPDDRFLHRRAGHSAKVNLLTDLEYRVWTQYLLSADDFGVMRGTHHPIQNDNDHLANRPAKLIQRCLDALVRVGLVRRFEHQGKPYVYQHDWQFWQKVYYPRATNQPAPPPDALADCCEATQRLFGFHPGGAKKKKPEDSEKVPGTFTEDSSLPRADAPAKRLTANKERLTAHGSEGMQGEPRHRPPTLVTSPAQQRNIAHFGPCGHVPNFLHAEFAGKVRNGGADEAEADRQVRAFYADVEQRYAGQVVGEDPLKFWRARFAEQARSAAPMSAAAAMVMRVAAGGDR